MVAPRRGCSLDRFVDKARAFRHRAAATQWGFRVDVRDDFDSFVSTQRDAAAAAHADVYSTDLHAPVLVSLTLAQLYDDTM
jgi:hypothetical protein